MDKEILIKLVTMSMPFGKYKGRILCDLPEHYLVWFHSKGFKCNFRLHIYREVEDFIKRDYL